MNMYKQSYRISNQLPPFNKQQEPAATVTGQNTSGFFQIISTRCHFAVNWTGMHLFQTLRNWFQMEFQSTYLTQASFQRGR